MNIPYPHFGIPELASLTHKQRGFVWRTCIHPRSLKPATQFVSFLWIAVAAALGAFLGGAFYDDTWGGSIGGGLGAGLASYVRSVILARRYREEVRRFIEDHESELRSLA